MGRALQKAKSASTRQAILDAAAHVISEKGYSDATVDEIVKAAGVSKGVAYYHFKSKADIATAILLSGLTQLNDSFTEIIENSKSASEALPKMFRSFVNQVVDHREFTRFYVHEIWRGGRVWSEELHKEDQRTVTLISGQFLRAQDEGFVSHHSDSEFYAVAIVGLILTTSIYYFGDIKPHQALEKDQYMEKIFDFVNHGTTRGNDRQALLNAYSSQSAFN
ncbi:MAG: TetR/AcrR family transcriptional regulator [Eggerthellaceae bacterium]